MRRTLGLRVVERQAVTGLDTEGRTVSREEFPANTRLFAGRIEDGTVVVDLCDRLGQPRLRLAVDTAGASRIEMLDAEGHVTFSLPPAGADSTA